MANSPSAADITAQYQISAARMEVDRFIVPAVTIFIGLILCFFMLFPAVGHPQDEFFQGR